MHVRHLHICLTSVFACLLVSTATAQSPVIYGTQTQSMTVEQQGGVTIYRGRPTQIDFRAYHQHQNLAAQAAQHQDAQRQNARLQNQLHSQSQQLDRLESRIAHLDARSATQRNARRGRSYVGNNRFFGRNGFAGNSNFSGAFGVNHPRTRPTRRRTVPTGRGIVGRPIGGY